MAGCTIWVELGRRDMNYDCSNSRLFCWAFGGIKQHLSWLSRKIVPFQSSGSSCSSKCTYPQ
jgi:hypothetical protein